MWNPSASPMMQQREMRTLAASADYVVGSAHALTEEVASGYMDLS
jgi:hypothetical protein